MNEETRTKIINLYNQLDDISYSIKEANRELEDLEFDIKTKESSSIKDIENLKRELKRDGLYSNAIEEFLDNYMKYYNN